MRTSIVSVLFLAVFLGFAPVVFYGWLFFLRRKKKFQQGKQPTALLSMMFLGGIASVVFSFFAERYLINFLPPEFSYCVANSPFCQTGSARTIGILALATFAIVAPVEEGFKFLSVFFISWRSPQFTRIIDGAKYGIAAALGFASAENALYLFTSLRELDLNTVASTFLLRFALSSPAHLFYSGLFGYYLGRAQFTQYRRWRLIATGLFFAVVTHGLYDFVLFSKTGFYAIFLLVTLFAVLYFVFKSPENFAVRIPEFMRRHPGAREKIYRIPVEQELAPAYQSLRPILAEIPAELQPITAQNLKPEYLPKEVPSEFAPQVGERPVRHQLTVPTSTVPVRSIKPSPAMEQLTSRPRPALGPVPQRTSERATRILVRHKIAAAQTKRAERTRPRAQKFSRKNAEDAIEHSVRSVSRQRLNVLPGATV